MAQPLKRILMVEDEPDIRAVARLALERVGGFEVRMCENGFEALEVAPEYLPDLFLLDVMMPGLDGVSTLQKLRLLEGCATIPAIFMTAKVQRHEVEGYLALGAIGVIPKPFNPMGLAGDIRDLWNHSSVVGETR